MCTQEPWLLLLLKLHRALVLKKKKKMHGVEPIPLFTLQSTYLGSSFLLRLLRGLSKIASLTV